MSRHLGELIEENEVGLVVVDAALSPVQQRNLERRWQAKVIDRTGLILEIFGARARTHEGRLQVELAALSYQRSRLVRSWTHLERQRGGFGFLGGPGESQLEIDRRLIGERIARLQPRTRRRQADAGLASRGAPARALSGGGAGRLHQCRQIDPVQPTDPVDGHRRGHAVRDPRPDDAAARIAVGPKAILSDTVGFISDLPTHLVAAFRATLEEVTEADIVVHVRDAHHPDSEAQRADVLGVLGDLGLGRCTVEDGLIEVLNKIDLLDPAERDSLLNQALRNTQTVALSAATGEGCDRLLAMLDGRLERRRARRAARRAAVRRQDLGVDLPARRGARPPRRRRGGASVGPPVGGGYRQIATPPTAALKQSGGLSAAKPTVCPAQRWVSRR